MRGGIPFNLRGTIHQYMEVPAGDSATVFLYEIPDDYVGFLSELGVLWPENSDCYFAWIIDGVELESIDRYIGKISDPKKLDPPYVVKDYIKFVGYNESSSPQVFGVAIDGLLYKKETALV